MGTRLLSEMCSYIVYTVLCVHYTPVLCNRCADDDACFAVHADVVLCD